MALEPALTAMAVGSFLRGVIVRLDDPGLAVDERRRTDAVLVDVVWPIGSAESSSRPRQALARVSRPKGE